ncbi:hypothetical protein L0Y69_00820 [bacterium]|nr:hypothetical protein [bacterium]
MANDKENITNAQLAEMIGSFAIDNKRLAEMIGSVAIDNKRLAEMIGSVNTQLGEKIESIAAENKQLAEMLKSVAVNLLKFQQETTSFQVETERALSELRGAIQELNRGSLTKEEKEELLAMARHYDKWLEDDALGKKRITLLRKEYDLASLAEPFPNRFQSA